MSYWWCEHVVGLESILLKLWTYCLFCWSCEHIIVQVIMSILVMSLEAVWNKSTFVNICSYSYVNTCRKFTWNKSIIYLEQKHTSFLCRKFQCTIHHSFAHFIPIYTSQYHLATNYNKHNAQQKNQSQPLNPTSKCIRLQLQLIHSSKQSRNDILRSFANFRVNPLKNLHPPSTWKTKQ